MMSGLSATFVEAPLALQQSLQIPQDHYDVCKTAGIKTAGNAVGNTQNYLDLKGVPEAPGEIPGGFTTRGIVALVFSCVAAFLGMAVIVWYGKSKI
jgi:iron transport multicopper oxidase